jgi:hypothetical protein
VGFAGQAVAAADRGEREVIELPGELGVTEKEAQGRAEVVELLGV